MNLPRRSFLAAAGSLIFLPSPEPVRVYSFMPGYELIDRRIVEFCEGGVLRAGGLVAGGVVLRKSPWRNFDPTINGWSDPFVRAEDLNDYRESARVWGIALRFV